MSEKNAAPVASMTGYANITGAAGAVRWAMEARSVNGRGLDIKLRLPTGLDLLDGIVKERFRACLLRGNVSVSIQIETDHNDAKLSLNESLVQELTRIADRASAITGQKVSLENLFSIRGVLEDAGATDQSAALIEAVMPEITTDIDRLALALVHAREAEGGITKAVLQEHAEALTALIGLRKS